MVWFFRVKTTLNTDEPIMPTLSKPPDLRGSVMHNVHTAVLMREHGVSHICTRSAVFRRSPFLTVLDPSDNW